MVSDLIIPAMAQPYNLALHRPAWQTSTAYDGEASRAVDGGHTTTFAEGSCSHTNDGPVVWGVDLGLEVDVYYVEVLNRAVGGRKYWPFLVLKTVYHGCFYPGLYYYTLTIFQVIRIPVI